MHYICNREVCCCYMWNRQVVSIQIIEHQLYLECVLLVYKTVDKDVEVANAI